LKSSKFLIIIMAFFLFGNIALAVAKPAVMVTPANGSAWLSEIDNTIEKLIASNQESSQKIEEMTGEIQRLTTTLVGLTWVLILITLLPFIIRFFQWFLSRKRQETIIKKKKRSYPADRLLRIRSQLR
jgi:hypothetical protein